MSKISEYLNQQANKAGWDSSRKFADMTGISKSTAAAILGGVRLPNAETLKTISNHTGWPLGRMLELANLPLEHTPIVVPRELWAMNARQRRLWINIGKEFARSSTGPSHEPADDGE